MIRMVSLGDGKKRTANLKGPVLVLFRQRLRGSERKTRFEGQKMLLT